MKKFVKILALVMAAVLMMTAFCPCSAKEDEEKKTESEQTQSSDATE